MTMTAMLVVLSEATVVLSEAKDLLLVVLSAAKDLLLVVLSAAKDLLLIHPKQVLRLRLRTTSRGSRQTLFGFISLTAIACAPQRPAPGTLAPVAQRASNESRAADLAAIGAIEARRVAMLRNDGADLPARRVALARAGAWLAFAREAYEARPLSREADDALAEARKLMAPFEAAGQAPATRSALATSADRLSPDNWARVGRLASKPETVTDAASLAEAEIELVRAARPALALAPVVMLAGTARDSIRSAVVLPSVISETSVSALSCPAVRHIARAVGLLAQADVLQAGEARQVTPRDRLLQDPRLRAPLLHFAVKSDVVGMPSAALLSGVAGALKAHPELSLVIEGYADPRGGDDDNRVLSGRRAETVRGILADSGVSDDLMLVRQFGESHRAAAGTSAVDYARDRRVQLKFVLPDGEELPITDDSALDLQIERVVIRAARVRRRRGWTPNVRRIVPEPASDASAPVRTPR
jgi:outer membrane protein OmpA-like peptidoglycan-associated protein